MNKKTYAINAEKNIDDTNINMVSNMSIYKYDNVNTLIPLFLKNVKIPKYVNGEKSYIIKESDINRIDNISYNFYGTPELYWVIMLINNIISPFDLKTGDVIRILPIDYIKFQILRLNKTEESLF